MNRRIAVFVALAVVLAALFIRLGFWQLDRLRQRRARNDTLRAQLSLPVTSFAQLPDSATLRRATLEGTPDYANEIVVTGRSRDGSPGVHLLTPVRPSNGDSVVLVNRGWAYAPDAATVDQARWREARSTFSGYVQRIPGGAALRTSRGERSLRGLTLSGVRAVLPYSVASRYLVSQDTPADTAPARLPAPALDDGPHLSYAIQWFSFATIALVGAGIVTARARLSPESTNRTEVN